MMNNNIKRTFFLVNKTEKKIRKEKGAISR